jgi:hypothetical protein
MASSRRHADSRLGRGGSRSDSEPVAGRPAVLRLQRAAGNRAVARLLQRTVSGDPQTEDVGEFFTKRLTPDELRQETAVLVSDLESPGLDPTRRATEEANLETFETYATAHHMALPSATAHHLRQVATTLAADLAVLAGAQREVYADVGEGSLADYDHPAGNLAQELTWSVDQLGWAVQAAMEAIQLTAAGKFQEAGTTLTAAMAVAKAVATHLGYLQVAVSVEKAGKDLGVRVKVRTVREILHPYVMSARHPSPSESAKGVSELLDPANGFNFDFHSWVDELQDRAAANDRFLKWVGIIQLGLLALDIWMLPVAGAPRMGGGGGPIGAPAGGGVAVGAVASEEVLESLRRLAALGVLTAPALVKLIGGPSPAIQAPPKPMQTGGGAGAHGPLEGAVDHLVYDARGDLITDIDLIENDTLWEKKSATNAGDVKDWVAKHITEKFDAYLRARDRLPAYYKNAKIGFIFEGSPKAELWDAIMDEIERLQQLHPDTIEFYID